MSLRNNIGKLVETGQLLLPGFLYALLSLLLSSHRILSDQKELTLYVLNIAQLLAFGITIAKYACDQMLLTRLKKNQRAEFRNFFLTRALPLSFIFSLFVFFTHHSFVALTLLICLPVEVWVIVVCTELNVAGNYKKSMLLNLFGYPLFLSTIIFLSFIHPGLQQHVLVVLVSCSLIKLLITKIIRIKGEKDSNVLLTSGWVPMQQTGNYLLFKLDQIIIAIPILFSWLISMSIPSDYLFYCKLSEVFAGIATSLSPIIIKMSEDDSGHLNISSFFRKKQAMLILVVAILIQILCSFLFLKDMDCIHIALILPFALATILMIPVNIANYQFFRANHLQKSTQFNYIALFFGTALFFLSYFLKSVILFAWIVPVQLFVFFISSYRHNKYNHV